MAKQTFTSGQTLTAAQMNDLQTNDFNMSVSTQTANYTLQASDKGTREVMNMGSAGTVTVPNSVFNAGDALWVHSIGSGTISLVAGAGMTLNSSAGTAPTLAQWEGGVVYFTSASSSIFFRGGGVGNADFSDAATGTYSSGGTAYKYITYTASGTLTVTKAGFADLLIVAGGGSGGAGVYSGGGGGGGGHLTITDAYLPVGTATITVGAGGASVAGGSSIKNRNGKNGNASRVLSYYSPGGGGGGSTALDSATLEVPQDGLSGGSGGGAAGAGTSGSAGAGTSGLGSAGGTGGGASNYGGGGGGGGSATGSNGTTTAGGAGGAGTSTSLDNSATTRAGGGGGGAQGGTAGSGGSGGGGGGSNSSSAATNGTVNTGGGGGGGGRTSSTTGDSGAGGSGLVIVRVKV